MRHLLCSASAVPGPVPPHDKLNEPKAEVFNFYPILLCMLKAGLAMKTPPTPSTNPNLSLQVAEGAVRDATTAERQGCGDLRQQ